MCNRREEAALDYQVSTPVPDAHWYAVWIKSRQERVAAARLAYFGISTYLPLQSELRLWSDRQQSIEMPLFPGYLFVRVDLKSGNKLRVLQTPGVVGIVGNGSEPVPIPDEQIDSVRTAILCGAKSSTQAFLEEGESVRVVRGALAGIEGSFVRFGSRSHLIITIEMIQRSVEVSISERDVEPVASMLPPSISESNAEFSVN